LATLHATAALAAGEPLKVVSERLGHASTSITANLYQHVLPSMDERTANAVANLILGDREEDDQSAVNPLSMGPQVYEPREGGDVRTPSSERVSEGRLKHYAYQGSPRRWRCSAESRRATLIWTPARFESHRVAESGPRPLP
jgi:hypothetical protein